MILRRRCFETVRKVATDYKLQDARSRHFEEVNLSQVVVPASLRMPKYARISAQPKRQANVSHAPLVHNTSQASGRPVQLSVAWGQRQKQRTLVAPRYIDDKPSDRHVLGHVGENVAQHELREMPSSYLVNSIVVMMNS